MDKTRFKSKSLIIFLSIGVIFLLATIFYQNSINRNLIAENEKLNSELSIKYNEIDSLKVENVNLKNKNIEMDMIFDNMKNEVENNKFPSDLSIQILKSKGVNDYNYILKDLTNHSELIEYKPVLGGKMAFILEESIVLNDKLVFAYFEDGHIAGQSLLSYEIKPNLEIKWTVIKSFIID